MFILKFAKSLGQIAAPVLIIINIDEPFLVLLRSFQFHHLRQLLPSSLSCRKGLQKFGKVFFYLSRKYTGLGDK